MVAGGDDRPEPVDGRPVGELAVSPWDLAKAHRRYLRASGPVLVLDGFIVVLVLVGLMVDDFQDLDEAEDDPKLSQGRHLVRIQLGHGPSRLPPRWIVASSPEVQIDPAALELELVDLALAVVLAAGLEREQFGISRELLQLGQQFSYRHALRVARPAYREEDNA